MSDPTNPAQDAVLILLQRLSESQVEHGRKIDDSAREMHETRRTLDVLAARLEPLSGLPSRVSAVETLIARHDDKIEAGAKERERFARRISTLEETSQQRKGWEGPFGKSVAAVGGALITMLGFLFVAYISK